MEDLYYIKKNTSQKNTIQKSQKNIIQKNIKKWIINKFILLLEYIEMRLTQFIIHNYIIEKIEKYEKKIFKNEKLQFLWFYIILYLSSKVNTTPSDLSVYNAIHTE